MYIHCNFCLNLYIIHGDMEENVSGCFFLNTVQTVSCVYVCMSNILAVSKRLQRARVSTVLMLILRKAIAYTVICLIAQLVVKIVWGQGYYC